MDVALHVFASAMRDDLVRISEEAPPVVPQEEWSQPVTVCAGAYAYRDLASARV